MHEKHNLLIDLPRKQSRVHTPLPDETLKRLEELADVDARPIANMASLLIQAAIELMDEQGFRLIEGKLRKVAIEGTDIDLEHGGKL
jgi:predicted DNA-binding protein